jgi:tungstate transport system permease protein
MIWDSIKQAFELLTTNSGVWSIILRSLEVSGAAVFIATLISIPLGLLIGMTRFPGRGPLLAIINTGMALPPVVVGLIVYILLSRSGPLGFMHMLYTKQAMVVAQLVLAIPFVLGITVSSITSVPDEAIAQARSLGATRLQTTKLVLSEARLFLLVAIIAGAGRVIAEVGAVMMVGGNFEGDTQVMTTAIMEEVRKGNYSLGLALGAILLLIALAANSVMTKMQQHAGGK